MKNSLSGGPNLKTERAKLDMEQAKMLWDEYKYRHDLIWKNIYKVTAASVALSAVPYAKTLSNNFDTSLYLLLIPPLLAVILTVAAFVVMKRELDLFWSIKKKYREFQNSKLKLGINHGQDYRLLVPSWLSPSRKNGQSEQRISHFENFVCLYLIFLLVLVVSNLVFAALALYW